MYIFDPSLPSHEDDMVWFQVNVWQVMETFTTIICGHHQPNYMHEIAEHAANLLGAGGLCPCCNDTQETLQCMLKATFHDWSPRYGGMSAMDTLWMVWEWWFMWMQVCVLEGRALIPFLNSDLKHQLGIEALLSSPSTAGVV
jgi:hypothetical protein